MSAEFNFCAKSNQRSCGAHFKANKFASVINDQHLKNIYHSEKSDANDQRYIIFCLTQRQSTTTAQSSPSETFSQDFFCEIIVLKNSNQRQCWQIDKKGREKFVKVTQEAFK